MLSRDVLQTVRLCVLGVWWILAAVTAFGAPPASTINENYVVGTQTIGPTYRFTQQTDGLNTRQRATEDAKKATKHTNVEVCQYTEVNLVQKAMQGGHSLTNDVLPKTTVDYVSYSSYDSLQGEGETMRDTLRKALTYIETKLPPKLGVTGKRVFIGEYGFPAQGFDPEKQTARSRDVIQAGLDWGCPYILYWEMYNNEVKNGKQVGFWLIDDQGQKQPVYHLLHGFLDKAKAYTADFLKTQKRLPTDAEYRKQALHFL